MKPHNFHPTVLREYDVRGIVGETLGVDDAAALGRALATMIKGDGGQSIAVGRDGRLSSPELEAALVDGILSAGVDVIRVGLGPTPMLYYSVFALDADGGVMITGSHNPANYNGFKMMRGKASCFGADIQALGEIARNANYAIGSGAARDEDMLPPYVDRMLQDYEGGEFKIAWDAGNGAAGEAIAALVPRLRGSHELLYTDIDGSFPNHHPDPTEPENLEDLQALVRDKGLDMGIAFDGDGDRIGAIDSKGRIVWGDQLLSILARDVLADEPGATIIADVKASQVLFDQIAAMGGTPLMWRTGHSLIKTKMIETKSPLAGEMSGHIFFKHKYYGFDDALYAAVRLINAVAASGKSLTELYDELPEVINTPEMRFPVDEERKFDVVTEVVDRLRARGANFNDIDGARVNTADGWWLLRASNTQAVLVARCEAATEEGLARLRKELEAELQASGVALPR